MTGDQWYNVIRLALWLGFGLVILYGLYRLITVEYRQKSRDDE